MLESLRRLWRRQPDAASADATLLAGWAGRHGDTVLHTRDGRGVVIETRLADRPARIEWGPAQRDYMGERELRLRIELGLPAALEMMVMARALAQHLETEAYERLVHGQQTEIDVQMPEEARWLAMLPRVALQAPYAAVMGPFVVVGSSAGYTRRWVEGELATRLARAQTHWLSAEAPLVIMVARGRLYLRASGDGLEDETLDGLRLLAECACSRVLRALARSSETPPTAYAPLPDERPVSSAAGPVTRTASAATPLGPTYDTAPAGLPPLRDLGPPTDIEV